MKYIICPKCELNYMPDTDEVCHACREKDSGRSINASKRIKREKVIPRANIAFKCNYCNGGVEQNGIGFSGICSDDILNKNSVTDKRPWCSDKECPCRKYSDNKITRGDLDAGYKTGNTFTCHESQLLVNWHMSAGAVVRGVNRGTPNRLLGVQTNSLCMLTTREPGTHEKQRFIFGVFLVHRADEGDDFREGTVYAHQKFRISLTKTEAVKLKFWKYYQNNSDKAPTQWGTGLFRYISDEASVRILKDLVDVKLGTADEPLAKELLEYFCTVNGIR